MHEEGMLTLLVRLAGNHGLEVSTRQMADLCGDLTAGSVLRGLRRAGLDARLVHLAPGDLRFLPPASLAWLDGGPAAIVRESGPRRARLELATGETRKLSARS